MNTVYNSFYSMLTQGFLIHRGKHSEVTEVFSGYLNLPSVGDSFSSVVIFDPTHKHSLLSKGERNSESPILLNKPLRSQLLLLADLERRVSWLFDLY
jgi:hypothetical protein